MVYIGALNSQNKDERLELFQVLPGHYCSNVSRPIGFDLTLNSTYLNEMNWFNCAILNSPTGIKNTFSPVQVSHYSKRLSGHKASMLHHLLSRKLDREFYYSIITFTDIYPYAHQMHSTNINRSFKCHLKLCCTNCDLTKAMVESAWKDIEYFQCHLPCFLIHCIGSVLIHNLLASFISQGWPQSTVVAADRSEAGTLTSCTKAILNTTTESLPAVTYQHFQVCWFWSHPLLSLSQWNKLILLCNSDLTCPIFARAVCAQTLYLPFWSNTFGMVSFGKGSPLRRVPWMITTSPEYLFLWSSAGDVNPTTNSTRLHWREATGS